MYFNYFMTVAEVLPGIKFQSFANKQNSTVIIIITDTSLIVLMNVVLSLLIVW